MISSKSVIGIIDYGKKIRPYKMTCNVDIKNLNCKWIHAVGVHRSEKEANLNFDKISESDFKFMRSLGYMLLDKFNNEICNFYDLLIKR